jgi:hypothetical protein
MEWLTREDLEIAELKTSMVASLPPFLAAMCNQVWLDLLPQSDDTISEGNSLSVTSL